MIIHLQNAVNPVTWRIPMSALTTMVAIHVRSLTTTCANRQMVNDDRPTVRKRSGKSAGRIGENFENVAVRTSIQRVPERCRETCSCRRRQSHSAPGKSNSLQFQTSLSFKDYIQSIWQCFALSLVLIRLFSSLFNHFYPFRVLAPGKLFSWAILRHWPNLWIDGHMLSWINLNY